MAQYNAGSSETPLSPPQPIPPDIYGIAPLPEYQRGGLHIAARLGHGAVNAAVLFVSAGSFETPHATAELFVTTGWWKMDTRLRELNSMHRIHVTDMARAQHDHRVCIPGTGSSTEWLTRYAKGMRLRRYGELSVWANEVIDRSGKYNTLGPDATEVRHALCAARHVLDTADNRLTESVVDGFVAELNAVRGEGPARRIAARALYRTILGSALNEAEIRGSEAARAGLWYCFFRLQLGQEAIDTEECMADAMS